MFIQATVKAGLDACVREGLKYEVYGLHLSCTYHASRSRKEQCPFLTKVLEKSALGRLWGSPRHDHSNVGRRSAVVRLLES